MRDSGPAETRCVDFTVVVVQKLTADIVLRMGADGGEVERDSPEIATSVIIRI